MINRFRRTATVLAALAVVGGAGAGVASAADSTAAAPVTATSGVVHTWFDPFCNWGEGFDWHYYQYCDSYYWHGSHYGDWRSFDRDHHGYDYGHHR